MTDTSDIKNALNVFQDGIKYYLKHFISWSKYMVFPVFGQILGFIIIFILAGIYAIILPSLSFKYEFFRNNLNIFAVMLLVTIPGLLVLLKAFWEYLLAYGSINSITANMVKSGNIYDIDAHKALITSNAFQFIMLWLIISILLVISVIPIFWIPGIVLSVYFVLIFQVFTFEEKPNAINAFKISFKMIEGHFLSTFTLLILTALISYILIPKLICMLISLIGFGKLFFGIFNIPETTILSPLLQFTVADMYSLIESISVSSIIVMFLLPMRSITWTLWYKKLSTGYKREQRKNTKSGDKQLDPRILDRATEDYE